MDTRPDVMEVGTSGAFREDWNERAKLIGAEEAAAFGKKSYPVFADYFSYTVYKRLVSKLGLTDRDRVLDIGCGPAKVTKYVAPHVHSLWGVDVSDEMLKVAKQVVPSNVTLVQNNGEDFPEVPSESFDVAYAYAVFIHLPRKVQLSYIKEALRCLRPGGKFLVHVRYNQTFEHFHPTFSGESFRDEDLEMIAALDGVESVYFDQLERWDDVCIDLNTRRWLTITKK